MSSQPLIERLMHGVLTPETEHKILDLLLSPQDHGKPAPIDTLLQNAIGLALTPDGSRICGKLVNGGGALF